MMAKRAASIVWGVPFVSTNVDKGILILVSSCWCARTEKGMIKNMVGSVAFTLCRMPSGLPLQSVSMQTYSVSDSIALINCLNSSRKRYSFRWN